MKIVRYQQPQAVFPRSFLSPWFGAGDEFERFVDRTFASLFDTEARGLAGDQPRVDLYEDKDNFHLRVELPGMKKDDIEVELHDGVLTVSGTRKTFGPDGKSEQTSRFSRGVAVPARVKEDAIAARYEDGVLTVTLPKAEEVKPKRVAVQIK